GQRCNRPRGCRLTCTKTAKLADGEPNLCNGCVVLRQVRRISRQKEATLIRFGVGQCAVEVIEGLQDVVGALDLRTGIRERGQLGIADEANRKDRAERAYERESPENATLWDRHRVNPFCCPLSRLQAGRQQSPAKRAVRPTGRIPTRLSLDRAA